MDDEGIEPSTFPIYTAVLLRENYLDAVRLVFRLI